MEARRHRAGCARHAGRVGPVPVATRAIPGIRRPRREHRGAVRRTRRARLAVRVRDPPTAGYGDLVKSDLASIAATIRELLERPAHHEAAHAVVALRLRLWCDDTDSTDIIQREVGSN